MRPLLFGVCVLLSFEVASSIRAKLIERDVTYVAAEYDEHGWPQEFRYGADSVNKIASDKRGYLYTVGANRISVFKVLPSKTTKLVHTQSFDPIDEKCVLTSVQTCKGFVTVVADDEGEGGHRVMVFRGYSKKSMGDLQLIHSIPVGDSPNHHVVTRDCRRIILGVEGDSLIGIITFSDEMFGGPPVYKTLSFEEFEGQRARLESEWFIFREGLEFVENFDIKYICLNDKETKAFVTLQDSNGIAVVDLTFGQEEIIKVQGMGLKDWSAKGGTPGFDGSITPKEARIRNGPIFGTYMAEHISCQTIGKRDYVFLAGEGKAGDALVELKNLDLEESFSSIIKDERYFGDLRVLFPTPQTDPDNDGKLNTVVTYGSRSYSAFVCDSDRGISRVLDTGSDLELQTKRSILYNSNPEADSTLLEIFDGSSVFRGPEPEAVITKKVCRGRFILLVGTTEDPGYLFLYTLDTRNIRHGFVFQHKVHGYKMTTGLLTDEELYNARLLSLRGTGGMTFVQEPRTKKLFVSSASAATSSVELYELRINCRARNPRRPRHNHKHLM